MDPIAANIITSLIGALVGALVSGILTRARSITTQQRAIDAGVQELLKAELYDIYDEYVLGDKPMPVYVHDIASGCYTAYHDGLGGNGTGTMLYEAISKQPLEKGSKNE